MKGSSCMDARLKTFLCLVETKNYTLAAEKLAFTQPTVSNQIKSLENEYGIKLFEKGNKTMRLTAQGEKFLTFAKQLFAFENEFVNGVAKMKLESAHFVIGVNVTLAECVLPRLLTEYAKRHPHVQFSVLCAERKVLFQKLKNHEIDWCLMNYPSPVGAYECTLLCRDETCVIVSSKHKLAQEVSVSFEQLKKEKMILFPRDSFTMSLFDDELQRHNMKDEYLNIVHEANRANIIKEFVAENLCISILQKEACRDEIREGKIVALSLEDADMWRDVNFMYHSEFVHKEMFEEMKTIYQEIFC